MVCDMLSFHFISFFCMKIGLFFVWTLVLPLSVMSKQQVLKSQSLKSVWTPCLNLPFKIFQQHLISPLACMTEPFQQKTTNLKHNSWTSYWMDIKSRHKNLTMWQLNAMGYSRKEKGSCDDMRTWNFEGYWKRAYFPTQVPETGGLQWTQCLPEVAPWLAQKEEF